MAIRKRDDYLRRPFPNWKCILFNLNVALFVISSVQFGTSVWLLAENESSENWYLNTTNYQTAKLTFMICSLINIILSLISCFGAANDEVSVLIAYVGLSVLVVILNITSVCTVLSYGFGSKVEEHLTLQISYLMEDRFFNEDTNWFLNGLQRKYKCCGTIGEDSYLRAYKELPLTCGDLVQSKMGCVFVLSSKVSRTMAVIIGLSVPTFLLQMACLLNVVGVYWESKKSTKYTPANTDDFSMYL